MNGYAGPRHYAIQFDDKDAAARFGRDVTEDYCLNVEVDACRVRFAVPDGVRLSHAEVTRRATALGTWKSAWNR
jgi:hypothetical protein